MNIRRPLRQAISTESLGTPGRHLLARKLFEAARQGFTAIELHIDDLVVYSERRFRSMVAPFPPRTGPAISEMCSTINPEALRCGAAEVRAMCEKHGIEIVSVQPLCHVDGLTPSDWTPAINDIVPEWISIARELGTDLIVIEANDRRRRWNENVSMEMRAASTSQLKQIAVLGITAIPPIRFAFKPTVHATAFSNWQYAWETIEAINYTNFGICLNTFHLCGNLFGDVADVSGLPKGSGHEAQLRTVHGLSMLTARIDARQVFMLEIADAERFTFKDLCHQNPYKTWSRNHQLFYGESQLGGYLCIYAMVCLMVRDFRYGGWVSAAVNNKSMNDSDFRIPRDAAARARDSFWRLELDFAEFDERPLPRFTSALGFPEHESGVNGGVRLDVQYSNGEVGPNGADNNVNGSINSVGDQSNVFSNNDDNQRNDQPNVFGNHINHAGVQGDGPEGGANQLNAQEESNINHDIDRLDQSNQSIANANNNGSNRDLGNNASADDRDASHPPFENAAVVDQGGSQPTSDDGNVINRSEVHLNTNTTNTANASRGNEQQAGANAGDQGDSQGASENNAVVASQGGDQVDTGAVGVDG